jgi:hypothetical protein
MAHNDERERFAFIVDAFELDVAISRDTAKPL